MGTSSTNQDNICMGISLRSRCPLRSCVLSNHATRSAAYNNAKPYRRYFWPSTSEGTSLSPPLVENGQRKCYRKIDTDGKPLGLGHKSKSWKIHHVLLKLQSRPLVLSRSGQPGAKLTVRRREEFIHIRWLRNRCDGDARVTRGAQGRYILRRYSPL